MLLQARRTGGRLLDMLYPRSCCACGAHVHEGGGHLCWNCLSELVLVRAPFCSLCGDPVEGKVDDAFICYMCNSHKRYFDVARSAARYDRALRTVLQAFKYNGATWLTRDIADLAEACLRTQYDPESIDAVCCVPVFHRKRRERGYNQAALLAKALASRIERPFYSKGLVCIRPTKTQTNLTAPQRATNVRNAYRAKDVARLQGCHVLLVDDVMTTGSTTAECSRVLKAGGIGKVSVITAARG